MYKRKDSPKPGDYVIATVKEISDMAVRVELDEYENFSGIIPIDEVSSKRITNIRAVVREGDKVVCYVIDVDENARIATLSLKRVDKNRVKAKNLEYRKERVAYNILKIISEKEKIDLKKLEKDIVDKIIYNGRKLYEVWWDTFINGESVLINLGIKKDMAILLYKYIKEYFNPPKYELRLEINMYTLDPFGINIIKDLLNELKGLNIEIKYLGAPRYLIKYEDYVPKKIQEIRSKVMQILEKYKNKVVYEVIEK